MAPNKPKYGTQAKDVPNYKPVVLWHISLLLLLFFLAGLTAILEYLIRTLPNETGRNQIPNDFRRIPLVTRQQKYQDSSVKNNASPAAYHRRRLLFPAPTKVVKLETKPAFTTTPPVVPDDPESIEGRTARPPPDHFANTDAKLTYVTWAHSWCVYRYHGILLTTDTSACKAMIAPDDKTDPPIGWRRASWLHRNVWFPIGGQCDSPEHYDDWYHAFPSIGKDNITGHSNLENSNPRDLQFIFGFYDPFYKCDWHGEPNKKSTITRDTRSTSYYPAPSYIFMIYLGHFGRTPDGHNDWSLGKKWTQLNLVGGEVMHVVGSTRVSMEEVITSVNSTSTSTQASPVPTSTSAQSVGFTATRPATSTPISISSISDPSTPVSSTFVSSTSISSTSMSLISRSSTAVFSTSVSSASTSSASMSLISKSIKPLTNKEDDVEPSSNAKSSQTTQLIMIGGGRIPSQSSSFSQASQRASTQNSSATLNTSSAGPEKWFSELSTINNTSFTTLSSFSATPVAVPWITRARTRTRSPPPREPDLPATVTYVYITITQRVKSEIYRGIGTGTILEVVSISIFEYPTTVLMAVPAVMATPTVSALTDDRDGRPTATITTYGGKIIESNTEITRTDSNGIPTLTQFTRGLSLQP
ncbi:hypothetical protein QBC35DRAFT_476319 [Podospora australis]|uniref:Uncharacterized protein n=1 Tax=Podospora australis TaxID=1536484 RepID=A0AAN7AEC5_9PEZI|nr:hypothetical protein QBC35DRAFT_476319 [Podospora australis]